MKLAPNSAKDRSYDITLERKRFLMCEPHMMAFTTIMKHEYATEEQEKRGVIACTNGQVVYYGKEFTAMRPEERCYVAVHELMHGVFMHPDRAQLIRLTKGTINGALFNYAGDAIINEGIEANPAMASGLFSPPKKFPPVRMKLIHEAMAEAISFTGETPPTNYDADMKTGMQVEVLYDWLMWAFDVVNKKRRKDKEECPRAQEKKKEKEQKRQQKSDDANESANDNAENNEEKASENNPEDDQNKEGQDQDSSDSNNGEDGEKGSDDQDGSQDEGEDGEEDSSAEASSEKPCTCGQCKGSNSGSGSGMGSSSGSGDSGDGQGEESDGQPTPGSSAFGENQGDGLTKIERMAGDEAWDIEEQIERLNELLEKGVTATELIEGINSRMEDARIRIEQVVQGLKLQGNGAGSLIMELAADMPKPVVPWNRVLRKVTNRGLGTKLNDSYVRYGSSTKTALARGARQIPFSPGTTIFTERPRVLVILDVSGSHIGMLPVCFSEIWSITQMKGAVVDVMTFDDGVQEIIEIKNKMDFRNVMQRGIRGGGGTNLGNVWDQVGKMRDPYRMAVIMTDGYLCEGHKPKIPVVWLVTPGGATNFSYGDVIYLPEVMKKAA